eukprot:m.76738 g.76738  ORF g.76738 m.76738 type:complete len:226 (+) comp12575_c0_seq4:291-968(+)
MAEKDTTQQVAAELERVKMKLKKNKLLRVKGECAFKKYAYSRDIQSILNTGAEKEEGWSQQSYFSLADLIAAVELNAAHCRNLEEQLNLDAFNSATKVRTSGGLFAWFKEMKEVIQLFANEVEEQESLAALFKHKQPLSCQYTDNENNQGLIIDFAHHSEIVRIEFTIISMPSRSTYSVWCSNPSMLHASVNQKFQEYFEKQTSCLEFLNNIIWGLASIPTHTLL